MNDLENGQTKFDLRLIALDLSTHKLLFSDVLDPQHLIITKENHILYEIAARAAIYLIFEANLRLPFKNRDVLYFSHVTRPGIPLPSRSSTAVILTAFRLHGLMIRLLAAQHNYNFAINTVRILFLISLRIIYRVGDNLMLRSQLDLNVNSDLSNHEDEQLI